MCSVMSRAARSPSWALIAFRSSRWNRFERSDSDRSKRRKAWKTSGASTVTESCWRRSGCRAAVSTVSWNWRLAAFSSRSWPIVAGQGPVTAASKASMASSIRAISASSARVAARLAASDSRVARSS